MSVQETIAVERPNQVASDAALFAMLPESAVYEVHYYIQDVSGVAGATVSATFGWHDGVTPRSFTTGVVNLFTGGYASGILVISIDSSGLDAFDNPIYTAPDWALTLTGTGTFRARFVLTKPSFPHEIQVP